MHSLKRLIAFDGLSNEPHGFWFGLRLSSRRSKFKICILKWRWLIILKGEPLQKRNGSANGDLVISRWSPGEWQPVKLSLKARSARRVARERIQRNRRNLITSTWVDLLQKESSKTQSRVSIWETQFESDWQRTWHRGPMILKRIDWKQLSFFKLKNLESESESEADFSQFFDELLHFSLGF